MAQIRSITARCLLDDIAQTALVTSQSLLSAIRGAKAAFLSPSFKSGRQTIATSGNGQSVSFQAMFSQLEGYTQERVAGQFQEYLEIVADQQSYGAIPATPGTDPNSINSDLAAMLSDRRLETVTGRGLDLTLLNWPQSQASMS